MMWWTAWLASAAAQGLVTHHPVVPSAGVAHENGPGALWVNPAHLAYDPDPRWGVFFSTPDGTGDGIAYPTTGGAVVGAGGLSLGVHNLLRQDAASTVRSDWSVDYGTSVALPERLAVGLVMSWNFIDGGTNYFAYDAGLAWRPLPWLGVSGVAQNVGDPDPAGRARPQTAAGLALRPFEDVLLLGGEWRRTFLDEGDTDAIVPTARLRPLEGLYLRGHTTLQLTGGVAVADVGVGLEVYFDGAGGGYHASADPDGALMNTFFVGSDEPGESLFRGRNHVATLELEGTPAYQPMPSLFLSRASWLDTLELLRRVEGDPSIRGLALHLDAPGLPFARARELRARLAGLRADGKKVLVYLDANASNTDCYVASAADRIVAHPTANVQLVGLSADLVTARGLLDLVGIEPQFVKRGIYKSAPEQNTHLEPSEASLEQTTALLDDLYAELVAGLAEGRGVDEATVRTWIDGGPYSAQGALDAGILDALAYPDELDALIDEHITDHAVPHDLLARPQAHSPWEDPKQIAVLYITGPIVGGESRRGGLLSGAVTGSDTIVRQLERAADDPQVRAVVLRVDSPGGSVYASDAIWRAVEQLKETDKPVVVSMGSVAASGGYYVSAGADAIWAEPVTITGSIGVYSGKMVPADLLDRVGVEVTSLGRGRNSGIDSPLRPWDDVQRARLQSLVDETYDQFKDRVATGRGMTPEAVEAIAQGRVWSGVDAHDNGLVDALGGLQDAIADARERAGIAEGRKVGLVTYSFGGGVFETLAPSVAVRAVGLGEAVGGLVRLPDPTAALAAELAPLRPVLAPLQLQQVYQLEPAGTPWALAPWAVRIEEAAE